MDAKTLPRGIRNDNPGNIRHGSAKWQGLDDLQPDPDFVTFKDPKWGIRAMARILITYQDKHRIRTIRRAITRWAPPVENNTEAYISHVAYLTGLDPEQEVSFHDHAVMALLVPAIIQHENGMMPYTDAQIDAGLALAGIEPSAKPLTGSRTMQGAGAAAAGSVLMEVSDAVQGIAPAFPLAQTFIDAVPYVAAALVVAGLAYVVYARWDDSQRKLR